MASNNVRVRFAPSPTGPLHIGGVRTALYNYLLAKKLGGTFILRIEDTDQKRFVPGAEEYIKESLQWAGIDYDEGPGKEGTVGPYKQSERKHLYRQYADMLIENGWAYYAFDTAEDLDAMRERLRKAGKAAPKYDMFVREYMKNSIALPADEVQAKIAAGEPYVIRLKVPRNEEIRFEDEIRGWVSVKSEELDDKVLFKSDGMPTYHLANIVDDHLMEISHVIRGEEWLPSAPMHVLLYRAFGWEAPRFAHLPLILKPDPATYINKGTKARFAEQFAKEYAEKEEADLAEVHKIVEQVFANPKDLNNQLRVSDKDPNLKKSVKEFLKKAMYGKLSKRDGDRLGFPVFPLSWPQMHITGYRESGYMPQAFLNILAMLGWNPGTNQEVFSKEELIESFSLARVGKSGAKFDPDKARWYNQQFLRKTDSKELLNVLQNKLDELHIQAESNYVAQVIDLVKEKATFSSELWDLGSYFFIAPTEYAPHVIEKKWDDDARKLFAALAAKFAEVNYFTAENAEMAFQATGEENGIEAGKYMQLLRVIVTGQAAGPAIYDTLALLNRHEVVSRIKKAIERLG
ncbi:glutamate--tRNA ligase [bacterium]|nr:glutamate--tRNA ligase [bacterium]